MVGLRQRLDTTVPSAAAAELRQKLESRVVGQPAAINKVVAAFQTFTAGLSPAGRPICNLLFLGPTGTGKTRVVEATADALFGSPRAFIKIDCAEFQHSHEIAKLIGSPPGYLGHRETHPLLSQEAVNRYQTESEKFSLVLFDEIEKASDALWNLLLGILDKGTLTLGDNRQVDFSRCFIFLTSNLGARQIESMLRPGFGFLGAADVAADGRWQGRVEVAATEAARRRFSPEFMNRIDHIVVFNALGERELRGILDIELNGLRRHILESSPQAPFVFSVTPPAKTFLLREGSDPRYGARDLKRSIERHVTQDLAGLVASGQIHSGDWIQIDLDREKDALCFYKEAEGLPLARMAEVPVSCEEDRPSADAAAAVRAFPRRSRARAGLR